METSKNLFLKATEFMKGKWLAIILLLITPSILGSVLDSVDKNVTKLLENNSLIMIFWIVIYLIITAALFYFSALFKIGLIKYIHNNYESKITIKESLKINWKTVIIFAVLGMLVSFMTIIPLILFIIPAIVFGILTYFANLIFVIRGKGIMDTFVTNYFLIKGRVWEIVKKSLYPLWLILPYVLGLIFLAFMFFLSFNSQQIILMIILVLVALPLLYKITKTIIISIPYLYFLFLELENSMVLSTDENQILKIKKNIKIYIGISVAVSILVMIAMIMSLPLLISSGILQ